jgi:hypothetical protein
MGVFFGDASVFFKFFCRSFSTVEGRRWAQIFTDECGARSAIPFSYLDPEVPPSGRGDVGVSGP